MGDPLSFLSEDGWAYPDDDEVDQPVEPVDIRFEVDEDLIALHTLPREAVSELTDLERAVIVSRFGFDGQLPRTLAQLHEHLGLSHKDIRISLVQGLEKLRARLSAY